jgi:hypothetical protein
MQAREERSQARVQVTINALAANSVVIAPGENATTAAHTRTTHGWIKDKVRELQDHKERALRAITGFVNNSINDVRATLGDIAECTSGCLAHIDAIRVRLFNRAMEYANTSIRYIIADAQDSIIEAEGFLGIKLERPPSLTVVLLENPYQSVWQYDPDHPGVNEPVFIPVTINDVSRDTRRKLIYVHGAGFDPDPRVAFEYFKALELETRIFQASSRNTEFAVLLVSWDSVMTGQNNFDIRQSLGLPRSGDPAIELGWGIWATYWRELEHRAHDAALELIPWIEAVLSRPNVGQPFTFSHSLGCYVWAAAMSRVNTTGFPACGRWWCMQAAIPFGSFNLEGDYTRAGQVYASADQSGLRVWFSNTDGVLSTLYVFATGVEAVGRWGVYGTGYPINTEDVTALAKVFHDDNRILGPVGVRDSYFTLVGPRIRELIQQDLPPIHHVHRETSRSRERE